MSEPAGGPAAEPPRSPLPEPPRSPLFEPPHELDQRQALEAILFVADQPVDERTLAAVVSLPVAAVRAELEALAERCREDRRGFEVRQVAGGWRLYSAEACADVVERFLLEGQQARLTQAALETLAVVAYRQPVTRGRIAAVRGVNVDSVVRTLVSRGLVSESGTDPEGGGAVLYRTTPLFLERLGIAALDDLPALAPHLPSLDSFDVPEGMSSS